MNRHFFSTTSTWGAHRFVSLQHDTWKDLYQQRLTEYDIVKSRKCHERQTQISDCGCTQNWWLQPKNYGPSNCLISHRKGSSPSNRNRSDPRAKPIQQLCYLGALKIFSLSDQPRQGLWMIIMQKIMERINRWVTTGTKVLLYGEVSSFFRNHRGKITSHSQGPGATQEGNWAPARCSDDFANVSNVKSGSGPHWAPYPRQPCSQGMPWSVPGHFVLRDLDCDNNRWFSMMLVHDDLDLEKETIRAQRICLYPPLWVVDFPESLRHMSGPANHMSQFKWQSLISINSKGSSYSSFSWKFHMYVSLFSW